MTGDAPDRPAPTSVIEGYSRPAGLLLVLAGLAHVLAPRLLLKSGELGYDLALAVEFDPTDAAPRRVRIAGVGMILAGAHLAYYRGVRP